MIEADPTVKYVFKHLPATSSHGVIDLETGKTAMIDVKTVDAASTIRLLQTIEAIYLLMAIIDFFWTIRAITMPLSCKSGWRKLDPSSWVHCVPAYCPHLNPIEPLWDVMHKHLTHNKCYASYREFAEATLEFLCENVPRRWSEFGDSVTDKLRLIDPKDFRFMA